MANKYYSISTDSMSSMIESIKDALLDKYGDGVTIYTCKARDGGTQFYDLVFECPQISEKKIQFVTYNLTPFELLAYYSTEIGTHGRLVNGTSFYAGGESETKWNSLNLVVGDSFLMMVHDTSYDGMCLIGKTVGGVSICCGFSCTTYGYDPFKVSKCLDVTNNKRIDFVTHNNTVYGSVNMPYKTKLVLFYESASEGNMVLCLPDGTADTIKDLYMSMYVGTAPICTLTGLFSPRNAYTNADSGVQKLRSSLLAEFELE